MKKARFIIRERLDAGEQLPQIVAELRDEGYSDDDIDRALKKFNLKLD
jgi:hypothetical protein